MLIQGDLLDENEVFGRR